MSLHPLPNLWMAHPKIAKWRTGGKRSKESEARLMKALAQEGIPPWPPINIAAA